MLLGQLVPKSQTGLRRDALSESQQGVRPAAAHFDMLLVRTKCYCTAEGGALIRWECARDRLFCVCDAPRTVHKIMPVILVLAL